MIASKEDAAAELGQSHLSVENGIVAVYRLVGDNEEDDTEPIKLLLVNEYTIEQGIEPLLFGPDRANGLPFWLVIVDVSPAEFARVNSGELPLPHGWKLGQKLAG